MNFFSKKKRVFLDYASTTPVDVGVLKLMARIQRRHFENPSSLYTEGLAARSIMREARKKVADIVHAQPDEIIFTASGTEADNLVIQGIAKAWNGKGKPHIIVSAIEHPAILETCAALQAYGIFITKIAVKENGIIDPKDIKAALTESTVLVSVMYANNEIGTIQPLKEIAKVIREYRHAHGRETHSDYPYFHTDASQAPNYVDINREKLGVDLMTLDGSKIYGPKSSGALYIKNGVRMLPIMYGGGQEKGMRPGTENVSVITGFAEALAQTVAMKENESNRLRDLQNYFIDELQKQYGDSVHINGDRNERLPNNINICVPSLDAEFAVIELDHLGIACSSASACMTLKDMSGSYVIESLGEKGKKCAESSLRFTMGRGTKKSHIHQTLLALEKVLKK